MKLSAPIYHLKRQAKALSREQNIPLHQALDRIASQEGFTSWSLLAKRASTPSPSSALLARLNSGDLVLLGARPGHGKTLMGLELLIDAMAFGHHGFFFTLEYNESDMQKRFKAIGKDPMNFGDLFAFHNSDAISADYIITKLASAPRGSVAVIDYLQLLDQKRENPELADQVQVLKSFARQKGLIIVFISQIDRSYELTAKSCPDIKDVRLPNPLDLSLFNTTCFLNDGEVQIEAVR